MFIYGTHISHFKGLSDLWFFPNPDLNILIGPNNSGKTSILSAIKLVLDPSVNLRRDDVISQFDFYDRQTTNHITIRVWLKIDENEADEIIGRFGEKCSFWKKTINNTLEPVIIDPIHQSNHEYLELLALELKIEWVKDENVTKSELLIINEIGAESHKFSGEDREKIGFKLFPARRDPIYQFSMARYSLLSSVISDKTIIAELRKIQKALEERKADFVNNPDIKLLFQSLNALTSPAIMGGFDNFTLTFLDANLGRFRSATSLALEKGIRPDAGIEVGKETDVEEDKPLLPLSSLGDGVQNLLLLLQISKSAGEGDDGQRIIAIEEPEQNLEPSLSKWAFTEICRNFSKTKNSSKKGQIFVTTHSPSLISELKGAESLCRISRPDQKAGKGTRHVLVGSELSIPVKKSLEQHRSRYSSALLAQHALIVEGESEEGLLPVIFNALAVEPGENPFHLGLSIVNGENNVKAWKHSSNLRAFGLTTHLLMDYDIPSQKCEGRELSELAFENADFISSWSNKSPLAIVNGYDLEVMLVANISPAILFEAIKCCYADAGHDLDPNKWNNAKSKIKDEDISNALPKDFPFPMNKWKIEELLNEDYKKAFLFAALHGPHDCKNAKDMRIIAEYLVDNDVIPSVLEGLRKRIVECMLNRLPEKGIFFIDNDEDCTPS